MRKMLESKKTINWIVVGLISLIAVLVGLELSNGEVMATANVNIQKTIKDKAVFQGVHRCYDEDGVLKQDIETSDYRNIGSLMGDKASNVNVPLWSGSQDGVIGALGDDYDVLDDNLTCKQLFTGNGNNAKNILEVTNNPEPTRNTSEVPEFLENMGYYSNGGTALSGDLRCMTATYTYSSSGISGTTNAVCQDRTTGEWSVVGQPGVNGSAEFSVKENLFSAPDVCLGLSWHDEECFSTRNRDLNTGFLMDVIKKTCGNDYNCERTGFNNNVQFSDDSSRGYNDYPVESQASNYSLLSGATAGDKAVRHLSHGSYSTMDSVRITDGEKRILYQEYITQFYDVPVLCGDVDKNIDTVRWYDYSTGEMSDCYVQERVGLLKRNKEVNGIDSNGMFMDHKSGQGMTYDDIIQELKTMPDPSEEELEHMGDVATEVREDDENASERILDDCRNSGAGNSLGWILCPILEVLGDAAEGFYNTFIEPALKVRTYLFVNDSSKVSEASIPYTAWSTFRDIANTVFVIALLFVIFSQLTGLGIDNYGIKRILPKLIVAVVLINISYLICMICVDLSNILGNGLQQMMNSFGSNLEVEAIRIEGLYPKEGSGGFPLSTVAEIAVVGLIGGLAFSTGELWISALGPVILLSLIFVAINIIISLVFLFFLLSVRQAAIVLLIVISPLAMICYFLPNTKSLFDKWMKIFRAMLLVYPIAGLLIGGGNYVSKLILATGGAEDSFFLALTAMIMGIVPIFCIPTVLKNAIAMLPKFGETFNSWEGKAKNLSGKAKLAIKNSDMFKYAQQAGRERTTQLLAGYDSKGKMNQGKFRRGIYDILAGGRRGVQDKRSQVHQNLLAEDRGRLFDQEDYLTNLGEHRKAAISNEKEKMYSEMFDRMKPNEVLKGLRDALSAGTDGERMSAALSSLIKKGDMSGAIQTLKGLNESQWDGMDENVRDRLISGMATSGVDSMKAYTKYRNSGGQASFGEWFDSDSKPGSRLASEAGASNISNKSYADYLYERGETAITGYDKDEMKELTNVATAIRNKMEGDHGADGKKMFGSMLTNSALDSSDVMAKTLAEDELKKQIEKAALRFSDLGLNADKIGRMRDKTAQAIQNGYNGAFGVPMGGIELGKDSRIVVGEVRRNPQILGKTSMGTRSVFGL